MNRCLKLNIAVLLFNAVLLTNCIISGLRKQDMFYYFGEEKSVTFFSALFLGAIFFICLFIRYAKRLESKAKPLVDFWLLSAVGFFYLMLDEFFMIHEGMDHVILLSLGFNARAYNFDGYILGTFGLIGLYIWYRSRHEIALHKDFIILAGFAFACFAGMIFCDVMDRSSTIFKVTEESFKLVGVSYFLAAYSCVLMDYLKARANR